MSQNIKKRKKKWFCSKLCPRATEPLRLRENSEGPYSNSVQRRVTSGVGPGCPRLFDQLGHENLHGQKLQKPAACLTSQWQNFPYTLPGTSQVHLLPPVLPTRHHCEGCVSISWIMIFYVAEGPPKTLFSGWTSPHLPQHLLREHLLQLRTHRTCFSSSISSLYAKLSSHSQNGMLYSGCGLMSAR